MRHAHLFPIICLFCFISLFVGGGLIVAAVFRPHSSPIVKHLSVSRLVSDRDADHDGIDDYSDIVKNARAQIGVVTSYDTSYYTGGYPPDHTGACADVPWRALQGTGYDFKRLIDEDMQAHPDAYPNAYDSNINFRRTQNIRTFLDRHAKSLTTEIVPNDLENLTAWQGGDIVTFAQIPGRLWHIAIVSDKRRPDGVPYLIHNHGQGTVEDNYLTDWPSEISGHFRFEIR